MVKYFFVLNIVFVPLKKSMNYKNAKSARHWSTILQEGNMAKFKTEFKFENYLLRLNAVHRN